MKEKLVTVGSRTTRVENVWAIHYLNAMDSAAGRCGLCRVCRDATGYHYGTEGNFRALSRADQPIALQTLRDLKMELVDLVKINLAVVHFDGNTENYSEENLIVACQRCRKVLFVNRRSHDIS